MDQPCLGGASHDSPPPVDFGPTLLTSTTAAEWRVLSLNVGGDEDARRAHSYHRYVFKFLS